MNRILFMGPQGAGKGTVAAILKDKLKVPHISMGDIFRDTVKSNSPLGKKLQEIMSKGDLVPIEITAQMLKERMEQPDMKKGYILDGYPRNLEQAEVLDKIQEIDSVVVLDVDRAVSLDRLTTRRQCKKCGEIYNTKSMPPKKAGVCDKCGSEVYQRDDDKEEAINKRLDIYEKETIPLIQHYGKKVMRVDGSKPLKEVAENILKALKK